MSSGDAVKNVELDGSMYDINNITSSKINSHFIHFVVFIYPHPHISSVLKKVVYSSLIYRHSIIYCLYFSKLVTISHQTRTRND